MNPGIYVIIGFGENLYGEKSLGSISKIIRSFGKNAIEESEDIDERILKKLTAGCRRILRNIYVEPSNMPHPS